MLVSATLTQRWRLAFHAATFIGFAEPAGGAANSSKRVVLPWCSTSEFPMVNAT